MSGEDTAAVAVMRALLRAGVREFCVCSGARNLELVLLLDALGDEVRVWNFPEERCAGFFALGRMQVTGDRVGVVTTSGTAVAELLPAMVEAHYQGLPLVAVTADRPVIFRRSGAPQVIDQMGIFGGYAEMCVDYSEGAISLEEWSGMRPLHVNVCLPEPGDGMADAAAEGAAALKEESGRGGSMLGMMPMDEGALGRFLSESERLLVMVGALGMGEREAVIEFLLELGAPVWAEGISNLREDERLRSLLLRSPEAAWGSYAWKKVLRLGGVPSVRFWRDLEDAKEEVEVLSVTPFGYPGLARHSEMVWGRVGDVVSKAGELRAGFGESVMELDRAGAAQLEEVLAAEPAGELALMRKISGMMGAGARVFLGNSLPIRQWDVAAERVRGYGGGVYANRGANGIDGELSSFLGVSEGAAEAWGIFGDLTVLYDLAAPWVLGQLGEGRRRIVVMNNGGGKIFSRLPAVKRLGEGAVRLIENPHGVSFEGWAAMWGMKYVRWSGEEGVELGDGDVVLEVGVGS
ncbi:MAG: 2-succinyl-5-enolpyruvyl-6-hydroxy-3-cyclohexene-1-carboxylic-acid synthase [Verrucomicrobiota bacterium]